MNIDTAFPSNYLKAADVDEDTTLTIRDVKIEKLGDDERPIAYFDEIDKGLVLNKTNANTIKGMYTSDTDNWTGKKITLFATEVDYAGKQTMAIRVRMRQPKTSKPSAPVALARDNEALMARWSALWQKSQELNIQAEPLKPDATFDEAVERGKALKAQIELAQL